MRGILDEKIPKARFLNLWASAERMLHRVLDGSDGEDEEDEVEDEDEEDEDEDDE